MGEVHGVHLKGEGKIKLWILEVGNKLVLRGCYTRQFAMTIFSTAQGCNIVSNGYNIVPALEHCVAPTIVVANCSM